MVSHVAEERVFDENTRAYEVGTSRIRFTSFSPHVSDVKTPLALIN